MHVISIKLKTPLDNEHRLLYVGPTKKAVFAQKKLIEEQGHEILSWRYHDGSGWAQESDPEAWRVHMGIVGHRAIIVY